ncbi:hypothetical protein VTL71DRAFT_62 [Oculimacula yallundae]|uniref:Uncharacterized protein n=1 Tax=Oculimacula yallundae TaxID=86028 RepID=A0ABR4CZ46_9HELO
MLTQIFCIALAASPLVAAHGKVAVFTGSLGGNTTALGIKGGIVPGPGRNSVTEVDTTIFKKVNPLTDGLGRTPKGGQNTLAGIKSVMAQSGEVLPQVGAEGGSLDGIWHTVTTDGAGPCVAILDTTGTGAFSQGTKLEVTKQVPGKNGNIRAPKDRRFYRRVLIAAGIVKRASNVNTDEPMSIKVPPGVKCTGTVAGQSNVCLVKIANTNPAGPFGGVLAVQIGANGAATPVATPAAGGAAGGAAPAATPAAGAGAKAGGATLPSVPAAGAGTAKTDKAAAKAAAKAAKNNARTVINDDGEGPYGPVSRGYNYKEHTEQSDGEGPIIKRSSKDNVHVSEKPGPIIKRAEEFSA